MLGYLQALVILEVNSMKSSMVYTDIATFVDGMISIHIKKLI